jgi:hypothetical protein
VEEFRVAEALAEALVALVASVEVAVVLQEVSL